MSLTGYNIKQGTTSFDLFDWYYINNAIIETPANVTISPINNRLCLKVTGNTTITFPFNKTINFVAVGGGQGTVGSVTTKTSGVPGGIGGGVVTGMLQTSMILTIKIGLGGIAGTVGTPSTSIIGTNISVIANAGGSATAGSTNDLDAGSLIVGTPYITPGGAIGSAGGSGGAGSPGLGGAIGISISDLNLYVAGGGGGGGSSNGSKNGGVCVGSGGDGGAGNASGTGVPGENGDANTGGGGGGAGGSSTSPYPSGANGGSGVVYFYL
jgi:hypothetical protein